MSFVSGWKASALPLSYTRKSLNLLHLYHNALRLLVVISSFQIKPISPWKILVFQQVRQF
jgi:hypothetical protein